MADPYDDIARNTGKYLVPIALLLWGMIRARARGLRPGANGRAFQSLTYGLGTWVVLLLLTSFAPMLPWLARLAFLAVLVGMGVWAAVLGVGGLMDGRRGQPAVLPALGGIFIGLGLAGAMTWFTASGYLGARAQAAQPPPPGDLAEFAFRVAPPAGWRATDAQRMNPTARLAYIRIEPTMAFLVMADNASPGQSFDVPGVVSYVRTATNATQAAAVREQEASFGGRNGVLLVIDAAGPRREFHYSVWLSTTPNQAIVAMASAKSSDATPAQLAAEAMRVFDTIQFR